MASVPRLPGLILGGLAAVMLVGANVPVAGSERADIPFPLGLPQLPVPPGNPMTPARIDLGRKLFMDRRLSHNRTLSCAMCHVPEQGFTSNELGAAIGFQGRSLRRNAPTILNAAYFRHLFHDGRESTLENQVWGPLLHRNEMANPSIGYVIDRIRSLPDYDGLFERAFNGRGPTVETISQAIATYERTLVSGNSRFDHWYYGGENDALDEREQRGFRIFSGKGRCIACHTVGEESALFSDDGFHNTGIGYARSMDRMKPAAKHKVQLAPGVVVEVDDAIVQSISEPPRSTSTGASRSRPG